jgi:hypothetical protein
VELKMKENTRFVYRNEKVIAMIDYYIKRNIREVIELRNIEII